MPAESPVPTPRTILVVTRPEISGSGVWNAAERLSKILAAIAIPVLLGIGGWLIQRALQDQTVARDYTQLAVSLLRESQPIDPDLRSWAASVLANKSPVQMETAVIERLKSGKVVLPTASGSAGGIVSQDARLLAQHGRSFAVYRSEGPGAGPGSYRVALQSPLSTPPIVVVTADSSADRVTAFVKDVRGDGFTVEGQNSSGQRVDFRFHFIVLWTSAE